MVLQEFQFSHDGAHGLAFAGGSLGHVKELEQFLVGLPLKRTKVPVPPDVKLQNCFLHLQGPRTV
jgi:hypothetical protein